VPAIVEVNDRMCDAIARVLEQYSIPADIEDTSIEGMNAARISILGKKYWQQSPRLRHVAPSGAVAVPPSAAPQQLPPTAYRGVP
jgi:hypothetical protein